MRGRPPPPPRDSPRLTRSGAHARGADALAQNYTSLPWRGLPFQADVNIMADLDAGRGASWEFAIVMKRPEEEERHYIVDTIVPGIAITFAPIQRMGTFSVPYDRESVRWETDAVCDDWFKPCELVRYKPHHHDRQEVWIFQGRAADIGLGKEEMGCCTEFEGCEWYKNPSLWAFPFNATVELTGGSYEAEMERCYASRRAVPQWDDVPVGLEFYFPAEHGTSIEEMQAKILKRAEQSGAKLLWQSGRREHGDHGTQSTAPLATYTFPAGTTIPPGGCARPRAAAVGAGGTDDPWPSPPARSRASRRDVDRHLLHVARSAGRRGPRGQQEARVGVHA